MFKMGVLSYEQGADLALPGCRLQHVKKAMRRIELHLRNIRGNHSSRPREEVVFAKHHHTPLRTGGQRLEFYKREDEIMVNSLQRVITPYFFTNYLGKVGVYQDCQRHPEKDTLRIHASPHGGDFYFRCTQCGESLSTLEFITQIRKVSPKEAAQWAFQQKIIAEELSPAALYQFELLSWWRNALDLGRSYYAALVQSGEVEPRFGDCAAFDKATTEILLRGTAAAARYARERCLVRVARNAFGFPSRISLYSTNWIPLRELRFSRDEFLFDAPRWTDYCDWGRDLIVCPTTEMATAVERAATQWAPTDRPPIVTIAQATGPIGGYSAPFHNVWLPIVSHESAEFGLPFYGSSSQVRVKRFLSPDEAQRICIDRSKICDPSSSTCVEAVAQQVARDGRAPQILLNATLTSPAITLQTGRQLVARVAELCGTEPGALAGQIDGGSNPYALRLGPNVFLCRGGLFVKKTRTGEFSPISNFTARILRTEPYREGNSKFHIQLTIDGGGDVTTELTELAFNNAQRLWKALRAAAAAAALPAPIMTTVPDRKLLPSIIRGTNKAI